MGIMSYRYHVLDFETSDFSANNGEIAEIALLTCAGTELIDVFHQFYGIKSISPGAAAKNGLSVEQLRGWRPLADLRETQKVRDLIKYPIFSHNAIFERGFLNLYRLVDDPKYPMVCTLEAARAEITRPENNQLGTWLTYKGIPHRPHGALSDTFGLFKLILRMGWLAELDRINLSSRPKQGPY